MMWAAPWRFARHGHQSDRPDPDDQDVVAEGDLGQLDAVQAGGHHVGEHAGLGGRDILGDEGQVAVRVVDVEVLAEDSVFEVGELPTGEHAARVHGISRLRLGRGPVRRDGGDQDVVSRLEVLDERPHLDDFTTRFVAEDHVRALADRPLPARVHVGGARRHGQGTHDRVEGAADGALLLHPADPADGAHRKAFHRYFLSELIDNVRTPDGPAASRCASVKQRIPRHGRGK